VSDFVFSRTALPVGGQRVLISHPIGVVAGVKNAHAREADTEPLAVLEVPHYGTVQRKRRDQQRPERPPDDEDGDEIEGPEEKRADPEEEPPSLLSRSDVKDARLILQTICWDAT